MRTLKVDAGVLFEGWARMSPEQGAPLRIDPEDELRQGLHAAIDSLRGEALKALYFAAQGLVRGGNGTAA